MSFTYLPEDFISFYRWALMRMLALPTAIVVGVFFVLAWIIAAARGIATLVREPILIGLIGVFLLTVAFSVLVRPAMMAKAALRTRGDPWTYGIGPGGVRIESLRVQASVPWEHLIEARELATVLALHSSKYEAYLLPKRAISAADLDALRAMLRDRRLLK